MSNKRTTSSPDQSARAGTRKAKPAERARIDHTKDHKGLEIEGAPDFTPHFEGLLKHAGVADTPYNRSALNTALRLAWVDHAMTLEEKEHPPSELLKQLDQNIDKTQGLFRRLARFPPSRNIALEFCPLGEGTVGVETVHEMKWGKPVSLPQKPPPLGPLPEKVHPDGRIALINVSRLLERVRRKIGRLKRRRRGRAHDYGKSAVVAYASLFFREHSKLKFNVYPDGDFATFCKLFYSVVTGSAPLEDRNALQTQIRAEVNKPTLGM
jgi:hypothetical protein